MADETEHPLDGGHLSRVVRVGDTVRRPAGQWTPAVHALLAHLEARSFEHSPRVFGIDDRGREILSYLPGQVVGSSRPWPAWTRSERTLTQAAALLRRYHDAVADFSQPPGTRWRLSDAVAAAGEIICHNDVAPYNVVHGPQGLSGLFDWDVASPGLPALDVAFSAWQFVPLHADATARELGWSEPVDRVGRLRRFVDGYALEQREGFVELITERMRASVDRIQGAADAGDPAFQRLVADGHLEPVRRARESVLRDATLLQRAID